MIFFAPHSSGSALFITSLIFLFPCNDLAFPLIQNATNPYSNYAVECKDDISWVDVGYNTADCQQAIEDFFQRRYSSWDVDPWNSLLTGTQDILDCPL